MDWTEFDQMLALQRIRWTQELVKMDRRIIGKLKAIGQDAKSRAEMAQEAAIGECAIHASGPIRQRLDQMDRKGQVWKS